jgi:hypothetical protein
MLLGDELRTAIRAAYEEAVSGFGGRSPGNHPHVGRVAFGHAPRVHPRIWSWTQARD